MSATPPLEEKMSDSWIDLSSATTPPLSATPPGRVTPVPFGGEQDYMRMLREAQRESYRSSAKVSPITSAIVSLSTTPKKTSPSLTPKSPPNSPNPEMAAFPEELRGVYVNKVKRETNPGAGSGGNLASDIVWDWTSRPNIHPKEWKVPSAITRSRKSSESSKLSSTTAARSWLSKGVTCTLVITNILSFLLGTGLGIWLCKRGARACRCLVTIAL